MSGDRGACEPLPGEVGRGQRLRAAPRNAGGGGLAKNRGLRGVDGIPRRGDAFRRMQGSRKTLGSSAERGFLEAARQTEEMPEREAAWRLQGRRETRRVARKRETREDAWGRENRGNARERGGLETARERGSPGENKEGGDWEAELGDLTPGKGKCECRREGRTQSLERPVPDELQGGEDTRELDGTLETQGLMAEGGHGAANVQGNARSAEERGVREAAG